MRSCFTSGALAEKMQAARSAFARSKFTSARVPVITRALTPSRQVGTSSRHARKVGTSSTQEDTVLGALLQSSLRVQYSVGSIESKQDAMAKNFSESMAVQTKNFSEQFADQKLSHAESMALQTKNFSEQFADQKLSHAKFAENIVKQISEGQERTEASQERFSNELFDVRQDVAKNGIFARSAFAAFVVPPAVMFVFGGSLAAIGIDTGNILLPAASWFTADLAKTVGGLAMAYGVCGTLAFNTINQVGRIQRDL